jgi:hypothetical protein
MSCYCVRFDGEREVLGHRGLVSNPEGPVNATRAGVSKRDELQSLPEPLKETLRV